MSDDYFNCLRDILEPLFAGFVRADKALEPTCQNSACITCLVIQQHVNEMHEYVPL